MTHNEAVETYATERYLLGEMTEAERQSFEAHYFECEICADDLRIGSRMRDGVAAGLLVAPAARTTRPARIYNYVSWAAAASLALIAGYEGMLLRQQPQLAPQALAPVTLRAATRGAEAEVPVTPGAAAVTLAVPLDVAAGTPISYEVRSADAKVVASGTTDAPAGGAPLLVMLPVWTVAPDTHYIFAVQRSADRSPIDQFGFVVRAR
jgi:putative zinc finger protein